MNREIEDVTGSNLSLTSSVLSVPWLFTFASRSERSERYVNDVREASHTAYDSLPRLSPSLILSHYYCHYIRFSSYRIYKLFTDFLDSPYCLLPRSFPHFVRRLRRDRGKSRKVSDEGQEGTRAERWEGPGNSQDLRKNIEPRK